MASILGKKPFFQKVVEACDEEELQELIHLMDNPGEPMIVYLYGNDRYITDLDVAGVHYVQLMIDEYSRRYLNGFLIIPENGDDSSYGFFSFNDLSSHVIEIQLCPILQGDRVDIGYKDLYENLTAEEFRRTVADLLGGGGGSSPVNVPGEQATVVFIRGFRRNLNNRFLSAYEENLTYQMIDAPSLTFYIVCQITKGGEKLTEEQAKTYMKYMTGSEHLPKYNYDYPQNTLFIMKEDGSYWKPQYDDNNGLVLWYVADNFTRSFAIDSSSRFAEIEIYYKYHFGNILLYTGFLNGDDGTSEDAEQLENLPLIINKMQEEIKEQGEVIEPAKVWASASDIVNGEPVIYYLYWEADSQPIVTKKVLAEATPAQ